MYEFIVLGSLQLQHGLVTVTVLVHDISQPRTPKHTHTHTHTHLYSMMLLQISVFACIPLIFAGTTPLIVDTDIGGGGCMDVDDVAAICLAHALQDAGEAEILAILQNSEPPRCAGVIDVLNEYYGRGNSVEIGVYKGGGLSERSPYLPYVDDLIASFPHPRVNVSSQVPDAVDVYRRVLSSRTEDNDVVIASIGLLVNLEALLDSGPDRWSSLNGKSLVAKKVKLLATMGGIYPAASSFPECNFCGCAHADEASAETAKRASAYVVANWPSSVPVLFSGFEVGVDVQSGGALSDCASPDTSPCARAYVDYEGGPGRSRYSWDPLTTLIAVRGAEAGGCVVAQSNGTNVVNASTGRNAWASGPPANQSYLALRDANSAGDAIDALLCAGRRAAK